MEINIDGIKIHYEQHGCGEDVLLLHGWGASLQTMRPIMDALKDRYRVTALDFPGFGNSGMPPESFGVPEYTRITRLFVEQLGIIKTHIICHSFGGRVTILLAAEHPGLVGKIVFTDAAGLRKPRTVKYYIRTYSYKLAKRLSQRRVLKKLLLLLHIDVDKRISTAGSADYRALPNCMRRVFVHVVNQDLKKYLKHIKSSSLLIWGENDTDTPVSFAKIMEKEIPDAGLVVLPGAGHYAFLDCFAHYITIVKTFLGG
jgi:pimeloyl-ACP methyl ester carboxylesterase